ncbi:MAG: transporter substrate-binding domain-containing protein [Duganella sp.]
MPTRDNNVMRRKLTQLLSVLALPLVLGQCFSTQAAAQGQPPQRPLVLVSFDYPPYMEVHPGQPPGGMMVELVNTIFARMGRPVDLQFYPLARSLSLIDTPLADGFFTIKKTEEREQKYHFPREPLLTQDFVIFVRANSRLDFRGDVSELADTTLGVVNKVSYGAIFDAAANRGVFNRLEVAQTYEANFRKLLAGRMDALVSSRIMGVAVLKRLQALDKVKVVGPPIETTQSYLVFNRSTVAPELVGEFDQTLSIMRKDGSLKKIRDKYAR